MKQVDIRTHTVPNRPRSGNYPAGTVVSAGGGGSSSTIINEGGGMDLAEARRHFLSKTNADTAAEIISFAKGLRILSGLINKIFKKDTEGDLTDTSVMTALRVLQEIADNNEKLKKMFLRKDQEDTTHFLLNLLGGIVTDFIQSTDFVSGAMGTGMCFKRNADGTTYAEVDRLLVRMKAYFQMLTIMRTEVGGATMMFNPSGARITVTKVEYIDSVPFYYSDGSAKYYSDGSRAYVQPSEYGAVYRCYFLADDGETAVQNLFRPGNLARSQSFNIRAGVHEGVSNRFFWRLVTAVGDDWIELSATHCAEGSDIPQEGDVVCQMGDISDPDCQSAIVLSAFGDGAPYLTFYQGIDSYSLSGKDIFTIGYDSVKKRCFLRGYGDMYFGDRERKSYIEYTQEDGLRTRGKFLLESGEEVGAKISAMDSQISLKVGKDQLKATGIDIDSKTVTVTAQTFFVSSTSGTPIAVFTTDGKGNPVVKAQYIDVENLYVKHLDGAEGSLDEGTIGGFYLSNGYIGAAKTAGGTEWGELSISRNYIRVGNSQCVAFIGADIMPVPGSPFAAAARLENQTNSAYTNVGAYISVTGDGCYGVWSNAPLRAPAMITTEIGYVVVNSGSGWEADFSQHSVFLITGLNSASLNMPTETDIARMFGMTSLPSNFGMIVTFKNIAAGSRFTFNGIYDANENIRNYEVWPGNTIQILMSKAGGAFRYRIVNYYNNG